MKNFSDFNIKPAVRTLVGTKVSLLTVLNTEITVLNYTLKESKYKGQCIHMQISIGEVKHVVFIGYKSLIDMIEKVSQEDFPFKTTIIKKDDIFQFT